MKNIFNQKTRSIIGLSLGHFNIDLYSALLVPLYPFFTVKLGINLASISIIIALGHLVSSMLQPVFGFVADKLRHRFFMTWGLVLSSIFIPITIKTNTVQLFVLCLMLGMIGNAFFHPQVSALIKDFNKNNSHLSYVMGLFLGMGTIGYAIGPYLATFCVEHFGQNSLPYLSLIGLSTAVFMLFFVPKMPEKDCYITENFFLVIKEILKNKTCMFLLFISVIKSALSISFGTYIPFLLKEHGFSLEITGLIVTLFFVAGGLATMISSKIEKYINANGVIILSFLSVLPLTVLFLISLEFSKVLACILFILCGFFILLSVGIVVVQGQNAIPKYTGVISGVMQGFSWGIGALFLAPLGVIGQNYGIEKILLLMATIAFVAGLLSMKYKFLKV